MMMVVWYILNFDTKKAYDRYRIISGTRTYSSRYVRVRRTRYERVRVTPARRVTPSFKLQHTSCWIIRRAKKKMIP